MKACFPRRAPLALGLVLAAASSFAQALPEGRPEALGFAPERLARVSATVSRYVDEGRIAGAVTLVARQGQVVQFEAFGRSDVEKNVPMRRDTLFRIASMSKAVTSVAAMILVEEGRLALNDPVSRHLPAFAKTTVTVPPPTGAVPGSPVSVVPAKRAITVRDLLTHTAGLSYGSGPAEARYKEAGLHGWYFADQAEPIGVLMERLASLPFDAQPGEKWVYGFGSDVLGAVVEKASGQSLDAFFRTRIFEPLKMVDTTFFVPVEKRARLATVYSVKDGRLERAPEEGMGQGAYVDGPRACFSGGAGLVSTAQDYARLLLMLANGGALDGVRVLSPKTVELMTANHVGSLYDEGRTGFGLGFEVVEHVGRAGRLSSVGEFSWGSAYYSRYWVDPEDQVIGLFLAQLVPSGGLDLQGKFRTLVYQAIVGPPRRR
jgi:CubicO group peptidase (beta-lactamase class C family)